MVENLILQQRASGAVKRDFRLYIPRYASPNEILNMVIPILMPLKLSGASRINPYIIQGYVT